VPLSEEEQRILQEMEQKLREHDRDFVERVSHGSHRLQASRGARWSGVIFLAGTVLLLGSFRSSLALAIFGVLVMLVSALVFAQCLGPGERPPPDSAPADDRYGRHRESYGGRAGSGVDWSEMRRRLRSRFGRRD